MDNPAQSDATGKKAYATLRGGAASLTATADRASFKHRGGRSGEDAR
ncbi:MULTISPECIES: DUF6380 family protein [unclassified Streptomyces]|nr:MULTISPECIES: DUF6380 family protein [unclassified Streptomyces]